MSRRFLVSLERAARRFGIDPHQYWHLLRISLLVDFRRQSAVASDQPTRSALLMTCFVFGLFSLVLALFAFRTLSSFHYSLLFLAYSMLMIAFIVLSEFGVTIISPDDYVILGARPITSRTYFAVKLSNLLFYVFLIGSSLNIFPAVIGAFSDFADWRFPLIYFPVALWAGLFSAMLVVLLYGAVLRTVTYEKFKDVLVYIQVVFSFFVFFGYQLLLRAMPYLEQGQHGGGRRVALLIPPGWFAGLVHVGLGQWERDYLLWAGWGVLMTGVLIGVGVRSFSLEYSQHLAQLHAVTAERRRLRRRVPLRVWERLMGNSPEERVAFSFVRQMLRRNRTLKLRLYPALGFPIAFLVIGIVEKNLADPFLSGSPVSSVVFFTALVGPLLVLNFHALLPYSEEHTAAWLFRVAPVRDLSRFFAGAKKAFLVSILLPLSLITGGLFSMFWAPTHAFLHAAVGFVLSYLFLGIVFLFYRGGFPFSQEPAKMAQTRQVALAFLSMPLWGAMFVLVYILYKHPRWLFGALGLLLALGWIVNRVGDQRAARATWAQQG
jgi:ABC-2 type transport system permease protein